MPNAYRADADATIRESNRFLYRDPDNPEAEPIVILPYGGFYNTDDVNMVSYNLRNSLDYNVKLAEDHKLNSYAFMELRSADRKFKVFKRIWLSI